MPNPTTGILDSFNRANESPLSGGGNWANLNGVTGDRLVNNEAAQSIGVTSSASHWVPTIFAAPQEAYCTITALNLTSGFGNGVICRSAATTTWRGYLALVQAITNPAPASLLPLTGIGGGGVVGGAITLAAKLGAGAPVRTETIQQSVAAGDRIWLNCVGDQIVVYYDNGAGFAEVLRWTDTNITTVGRIGLYFDGPSGNAGRSDDFGGGAV